MDKIDLHRETREMIIKDLLHTINSMIKVQEMGGKVEKNIEAKENIKQD